MQGAAQSLPPTCNCSWGPKPASRSVSRVRHSPSPSSCSYRAVPRPASTEFVCSLTSKPTPSILWSCLEFYYIPYRAAGERIKFWTHCPLGLLSRLPSLEGHHSTIPTREVGPIPTTALWWQLSQHPTSPQYLSLQRVLPTIPDISPHRWPED